MMRGMPRRLAPWIWLVVAPACAGNCQQGPPDEGEPCFDTPACDPAATPEAAEIGTREHGFDAWQDGDVVELVNGGQGGVMILPSFCLPAAASSGEEACVGLTLDNAFDGADGGGGGEGEGEGEGPLTRRFRFTRDGERLCGGPLYDLLGYSRGDFGDGVTVSVDLCGANVHATGDVHVTF